SIPVTRSIDKLNIYLFNTPMDSGVECSQTSEQSLAQAKLLRFLDANEVATRYMNEGEYREMVQCGIKRGMNTSIHSMRAYLKDFLLNGHASTRDWILVSGRDTRWEDKLDQDLQFARVFLQCVRESRCATENIRSNTREAFLIKLSEELRLEVDLLERTLPHSKAVIDDITQNSRDFNRVKLREILNRGSRKVDTEGHVYNSPYHVMAIFNMDAVDLKTSCHGYGNWKYTKDDAKPEDLIASFAMLPQRDLYEDMVRLSSNAGDLSHPVFDSHGTLRYPK
ncbi:MAG: hypothetical protein KAS32_18705, partial [Candidatus Peribacteraceae bacterium]|nr:hypothetical protein [Candidatus Peribacteraceae bacterium]